MASAQWPIGIDMSIFQSISVLAKKLSSTITFDANFDSATGNASTIAPHESEISSVCESALLPIDEEYFLGLECKRNGAFKQAIDLFKTVENRSPGYKDVYILLQETYELAAENDISEKNYNSALKLLKKAQALSTTSQTIASILAHKAYCEHHLGQVQQSVETVKKAITVCHDTVVNRHKMYILELGWERYFQIPDDLPNLRDPLPLLSAFSSRVDKHNSQQVANTNIEVNDCQSAVLLTGEVPKKNQGSLQSDHTSEKLVLYKKVAELCPDVAEELKHTLDWSKAHYSLGCYYYKRGEGQDALNHLMLVDMSQSGYEGVSVLIRAIQSSLNLSTMPAIEISEKQVNQESAQLNTPLQMAADLNPLHDYEAIIKKSMADHRSELLLKDNEIEAARQKIATLSSETESLKASFITERQELLAIIDGLKHELISQLVKSKVNSSVENNVHSPLSFHEISKIDKSSFWEQFRSATSPHKLISNYLWDKFRSDLLSSSYGSININLLAKQLNLTSIADTEATVNSCLVLTLFDFMNVSVDSDADIVIICITALMTLIDAPRPELEEIPTEIDLPTVAEPSKVNHSFAIPRPPTEETATMLPLQVEADVHLGIEIPPNTLVSIPFSSILQQIPSISNESFGRVQLTAIVNILGKMNIGMEPDSRFGFFIPKPEENVVLFKLGGNASSFPSYEYAVATVVLDLASVVDSSEGDDSPAIKRLLEEHIGLWFPHLATDGMIRLQAHSRWIRSVFLSMDISKNRIKLLSHDQWTQSALLGVNGVKKRIKLLKNEHQESLRRFLRDISQPHDYINLNKANYIIVVYGMLGLDIQNLDTYLNATTVVPVTIQADELAMPLGTLDMTQIQQKRRETEEISAILYDIFSEENDAPVVEQNTDNQDSLNLDEIHSAFLCVLTTKETWQRNELEKIASGKRLLLEGVLNTINEEVYETYGEPLFEDEDPIELNMDIVRQILSK